MYYNILGVDLSTPFYRKHKTAGARLNLAVRNNLTHFLAQRAVIGADGKNNGKLFATFADCLLEVGQQTIFIVE